MSPHLLRGVDGALWDLDVASGVEVRTRFRADEVVLTPSDRVLVLRSGESLALAALTEEGVIKPFPQPPRVIAGVRRLLAARVVFPNTLEVLVTTAEETLLVLVPSGRVLERWPFVAPAGVGVDDGLLLWTPDVETDEDHVEDRRVVPGGAGCADAATVQGGACIIGTRPRSTGVSWETTRGLERRWLPGGTDSVAVVRDGAGSMLPSFVMVAPDGAPRVVDWADLAEEPSASQDSPDARDGRHDLVDDSRARSVFVSYAHDDGDVVHARATGCCAPAREAERIVAMAEAMGLDAFWDRDIRPGQRWALEILAHLHSAGTVVVLWGRGSVERWHRGTAARALGQPSEGQIFEVEECADVRYNGRTVTPVLMPGITPQQLPPWFAALQAVFVGGDADVELRRTFEGLTHAAR